MPHILVILIMGAIAGWVSGSLVKDDTRGLFLDIFIGIVGGWLGYRLFGYKLSITDSRLVNEVITAIVGATILSLVLKIIRKLF